MAAEDTHEACSSPRLRARLRPAHPRDGRQVEELRHDLGGGEILQLLDGDRTIDTEAAALGPAQRAEMRAAAQILTNIESIGPHVEPLGTNNPEVDVRQADVQDLVGKDVDETGLALDHLSLSGQLVERHS